MELPLGAEPVVATVEKHLFPEIFVKNRQFKTSVIIVAFHDLSSRITIVQEALDLILYRQSITSRVSHIYYRTGNDPNRGIVYVNIYLFMPCLHFDTPENADSVCRSLIE